MLPQLLAVTGPGNSHVGEGSLAWAMQVKGLELPGYEPRVLKALALALAVSPRGACHNRSSAYDLDFARGMDPADPESVATAVIDAEDRAAVLDALTVGKFLRRCFTDFYPEAAALVRLVTGWDVSPDELCDAGARVNQIRRAFNVREGWTHADDWLPERLLTEPVCGGPHDGARLTPEWLRSALDAYYHGRRSDADGQPPGTSTAAGSDGAVGG